MGAKGITLAEEGHFVNIIPPIDINGAGATSDYFHVKDAAHATILLQLGVTGAASTVTLYESDDDSGTTETAIAFNYYAETTAAGDTLGARTAATTSGFATSTNDNVMYVIEVDASELTDGKPYLALKMSDPSAATVVGASAILTGRRYADKTGGPTAIT
jgi:hypothetical protein